MSMEAYGCLWISMYGYWCLWRFIGICGCQWIGIGVYGGYGVLWISFDVCIIGNIQA